MMHLSSQARNAFLAGNYKLAAELYSKAIAQQPELSHVHLIFLNQSRKKLELPPLSTSDLRTYISPASLNLRISDEPNASIDKSEVFAAFNIVSESDERLKALDTDDEPLVSVIIAVHNGASTIESSITSLLRQSWKNLEIIVVDLASCDLTWVILQRLSRSVSNIKCYRLGTPQGLSFGLNHGLNQTSGDYVFFQQSSDFSHPDRIKICMLKLVQHDVAAVKSTYLETEKSNSDYTRAVSSIDGLMTLGLKRTVVDQIGYLSLTALSDEEYLERLDAWSKHSQQVILEIDLPLYYRSPPLDCSNISYRNIASIARDPLSKFRDQYKIAHKAAGLDGLNHIFPFPPKINSPIPLSEHNSASSCNLPVVANICSIPARENLLKQALQSFSSQVDSINIYLDGYERIPDFVKKCHANVKIYLSSAHPGLRDNGKFLNFAHHTNDCYYFTMDDDIIYPPDYVERMIQGIESYSRRAVVGLHGVLLPENPESYFTSFRKVHCFNRELEADFIVNNLGTGTVAFHSSTIRGLDITHFKKPGMADLYFSVFCKQQHIPMIALSRPEEWLRELPSPNTSLYHEFKKADVDQSSLVRTHSPWGYASVKHTIHSMDIKASDSKLHKKLMQMIPPIWEYLM